MNFTARSVISRIRPEVLLVSFGYLSMVVLNCLESALGFPPAPGFVAGSSCNFVKVITWTNIVDGEVDGTTPAETLASVIANLSPVEAMLWSCFVAPIHTWLHQREPTFSVDT